MANTINSLSNRAYLNLQNHKISIAVATVLATASAVTAAAVPAFLMLGIVFAIGFGAFAIYRIMKPVTINEETSQEFTICELIAGLYDFIRGQIDPSYVTASERLAEMQRLHEELQEGNKLLDGVLHDSESLKNRLENLIEQHKIAQRQLKIICEKLKIPIPSGIEQSTPSETEQPVVDFHLDNPPPEDVFQRTAFLLNAVRGETTNFAVTMNAGNDAIERLSTGLDAAHAIIQQYQHLLP